MSLADKVIKNTFYFTLFQFAGFLFPLILTPFIISKIGEAQFGLYALVLGFIGVFGLFDLSISSSFVMFISKHYVKKDFDSLNKYFNTGFFYYIVVSLIIVCGVYLFSDKILALLNIPPDLMPTAVYVFNVGLIIFFISSSFTIFSSLLIALQKMYITSIAGIFINLLNFILIFILLLNGYGLVGVIWAQLVTAILINIITVYYARSSLKELRFGIRHFSKAPLKEMTKFGTQMQVSKLAGFAAEKYDEFLLAYFSVLSNVTFFNVANRISRTGRMVPYQLIPQLAPVASELNAKEETGKVKQLFSDTTKYLTLVSVPVFIFIFVFAELIMTTWLGAGYEISAQILQILVIGQLINMTVSAPGNSIIPNLGFPKYQMYEGLIFLGVNLILSFVLIKFYGILGAAIGNTISTSIASLYIFIVSTKFFKERRGDIINGNYSKPFIAGILSGVLTWVIYWLSNKYIYTFSNRISGIIYILIFITLFLIFYAVTILFLFKYLNQKDKALLSKVILKVIPAGLLYKTESSEYQNKYYANELISLVIVTHNRIDFLKQCLSSLLPTLNKINYEIIIVDNASTDETRDFLEDFAKDNRNVKILTQKTNRGNNGKSIGIVQTKGDFIIGIDDDVIFFSEEWIEKMIHAYKTIPRMGYLAADVVQDETTTGAKYPEDTYINEQFDDVTLQIGMTGGWCFMISRKIYNKVGKFLTFKNRIAFPEDGDYVNRTINKGLRYGILKDVKVYHATGEFHNKKYRKIFDDKYADIAKGDPLWYKIKTAFIQITSIHRHMAKLKEFSARN